MNNKILIFIIALVIGGGSFFAGTAYQKSKTPSFEGMSREGMMGRNGSSDHQGSFRGGMVGQGMPVAGEIIDRDDESITVKLQDGGSKIVFVSDETSVRKTDEGNMNDLSTGAQVMVFGSENDDGSFTATNIQIGSGFRGMFSQNPQSGKN